MYDNWKYGIGSHETNPFSSRCFVVTAQIMNDFPTEQNLCVRMTALGAEMTAEDPDHVVTGREPARLFAEE